MPLFFRKRKPSEDAKKRLEYQLCLSKEAGADDILDISACELTDVPSSALSICKVLQKKVLILHGNDLKSLLPKTCDIISLATIKVLDLHENKLTSLPEDIGRLVLLQVLNVQQNQIKSLPDSIGNLQLLQTLNAKGNCLSEVPSSFGSLSSLRTLDLSDNNIHELPKSVAYIRTLESFTLDAGDMSYPPASVCSGGTAEIQRFLCAELGEEYCPPSQYLLPVLERGHLKLHSDYVDGEQAWASKFNEYEKRKEQKLKETLAFELQLEESHKEHAQLLLMNSSHKENVLNSVRMEQERVEQGFCKQQRAVEAGRVSLLARVKQAEHHVAGRITDLLMDASRQKKSAAFLTAMEKDRIHMEHLTAITQEEANSLRKRDVADAMQKMLSDSVSMTVLQEASDFRRQNMVSEAFRSVQSLDMRFDQVLSLQQLDKSKAIAHILEEEEIQKAAFEALQLQKDSVHGYIRSQIKLIENELMQLTKLEVKRRTLDAESLQGVLGDQRSALSDMLQQLLKQKDQREAELKQVLAEMERKSETSQQHYWMIQYQRLLESKPMSLRMEEAGVERSLVSLLSKLSAQHFLPILAHHHVTRHTLSHMTPSDLHKMGISEVGVQRALLDWAKQQQRLSTPKEAEEETAEAAAATPSAPSPSASTPDHTPSPPSTPGTPVTPSAPSPLDAPGGSECVVCMETVAQVIFLPCGHVCCCRVCSDALQNCPLCRGSLEQRVRIYHN